ncbi:hypothetical protein DCAR_0933315 [Daucus carota subsp. sativus]|uniref:ditrans,polycis-polyprenyl diphosphate synthase [(2E,6E)-farnesyldiphosphate specific] n=1 Tax=Daucus carota subsp. sativus TaxID=79200 RepID=A0AAF1BBR2_DAUCS|nr:hypothetical protein DCAR_0933315 [Daucus carota subsp. sativus]
MNWLTSIQDPIIGKDLYSKYYYLWLIVIWHVVHFIISIWYCALRLAETVESYLISSGLLMWNKTIDTSRVQYLAIVLDSEEACRTSEVIKLLQCIERIGLRNICLYDREGVLKKSKDIIMEKFSRAKLFEEACTTATTLLDKEPFTLEFVSFSDGKEAIAQAANYIFTNYHKSRYQKDLPCTESHIDEALKATGYGQPYPDLMLIYGPSRCNLGFPAWRIRYTEMVHMGPLKSMKYGSLIKAIHRFTMVYQNYGK